MGRVLSTFSCDMYSIGITFTILCMFYIDVYMDSIVIHFHATYSYRDYIFLEFIFKLYRYLYFNVYSFYCHFLSMDNALTVSSILKKTEFYQFPSYLEICQCCLLDIAKNTDSEIAIYSCYCYSVRRMRTI